MSQKLLSSCFLYLLMLKQKLIKISFLWIIILPLHTFFLILMSIQFNISTSLQLAAPSTSQSRTLQATAGSQSINQVQVTKVIINIWHRMNDSSVTFSFFIIIFVNSLVIIIFFLAFIIFKKQIKQFDKNIGHLNKLITVSAFLIIVTQLFLFNGIWHIKQILFTVILANFSSSSNPQPISYLNMYQLYMLLPIVVVTIFIGFINSRIRMMGPYFIIIILITQQSLIFSYTNAILGILMCILVIRKDQNHSFFNFKGFNCRKIIHLILILFFLWKLIDNLKLALLSKQILHMENEKNVYNNGNVGYIYLATIMTLGLILGFLKFGNRVNNKLPPVMQLCQCLLNLEANSQDNQSKITAFHILVQYFNESNNILNYSEYPTLRYKKGHGQIVDDDKNNNKAQESINVNDEQNYDKEFIEYKKMKSQKKTENINIKKFCNFVDPVQRQRCYNFLKTHQIVSKLSLGINTWKMDDLKSLIIMMINQQYQKQPSLELGISMIKCRLMIKDKCLFEIIQIVKDLILRYNDKNLTHKYQIFKIVFKLEQKYFKKHQNNDNPIIHVLRQVDKLNHIFYKICCTLIESMYKFWQTVVMYKIKTKKEIHLAQVDENEGQVQIYNTINNEEDVDLGYKTIVDETMDSKKSSQSSISMQKKLSQLQKSYLTNMTYKQKTVSKNSTIQIQMQNVIMEIYEGLQNLERVSKKISKLSSASRQNKILNYIKYLVTYTNQQFESKNNSQSLSQHQSQHHDLSEHMNQKSSSMSQKKQQNQSQFSNAKSIGILSRKEYSQFIQSINNKIVHISLKLSTQLGYKSIQIIDDKLSSLIPFEYLKDIEQKIVSHEQSYFKVPYLIPLVTSDSSIVLKNMVTHLQLDCNNGYRMLYHMTSNQINNQPIIIYNTSTNNIQYYNKQFVNVFDLDKFKLDSKIRNKNLNPDEIFLDIQLSDKMIQSKLSESRQQIQYNCRFYSSKLKTKKALKIENIRISMIQKQICFMLIKVIKGFRMKSVSEELYYGNPTDQANPAIYDSQNCDDIMYQTQMPSDFLQVPTPNVVRQNQNGKIPIRSFDQQCDANQQQQKIYCKIQNPFQPKISNKKIQLIKSTKFTLKFFAVLTITLAMLMLATQGFLFLYISNQVTLTIQKTRWQRLNQLEFYTQLMFAYQHYYEYILIKMHQPKLQSFGTGYVSLLQSSSRGLQNEIEKFQKQYLEHLATPQQQSTPYQIQFQNYRTSTDTSSTNLFDFSKNLLQYQYTNESLTFLLNNHDSFSNLIGTIMNKQIRLQKQVNFYYILFYNISAGIFAASVLLFILSTFLTWKIGSIRANIQHLFYLTNLNNLEYTFSGLKSLKERIQQIKEEGIQEQKKYNNLVLYCMNMQQEQTRHHYRKRSSSKEKRQDIKGKLKKKEREVQGKVIRNANESTSIQGSNVNSNNNSHINILQSPKSQIVSERHISIRPQSQDIEQMGNNIYQQQMNAKSPRLRHGKQQQIRNRKDSSEHRQEIIERSIKKGIKIYNLGLCRYLILILFIAVTTVLQILYLRDKVSDQQKLIQFKTQNKKITQNTIHQILEAWHYYIIKQRSNSSSQKLQDYSLIFQKVIMNNYQLPQNYFEQYEKKYHNRMSADLCMLMSNKANLTYNYEQCKNICQGILKFGMSQTLQTMNQLLLKWVNQNKIFTKSRDLNISKFQQILYLQSVIIYFNQQNEQELKTYEHSFNQVIKQRQIQIFILGCLLGLAKLVMSYFMKQKIYRAAKIGVCYFLILPKDVLLQYQTIDYLRRNNVLDQISTI